MGIGRRPTFQLVLVDVSNIVIITTTLLGHIWCIWIEVLRWVHEPYDKRHLERAIRMCFMKEFLIKNVRLRNLKSIRIK